jgi:hypothetical protein
MGGFGSGRTGGKLTTDNMRALDIRKMARDGLLRTGSAFSWQWSVAGDVQASINAQVAADRVTLDYRARAPGGEWSPRRYDVLIDRTPCTYGGSRPWWICPAAGCGRRCAVLYGGDVFACRHCYRLAYRCQRETPDDRAMRQADKIRQRLGWEAGIVNGEGGKPKGMHWHTFARLKAEHDAHTLAALAGMAHRFGIAGL